MVSIDFYSDIVFKEYMEKWNNTFFNKENINGEFVYKVYYDYVEKCYCSCIECLGCLKDECRTLFNSFNVIIEEYSKLTSYSCHHFNKKRDEVLYLLENGYDYDEDLTERTPILVEMELFTGDYIRKTVPSSYIIKMLNYKGGDNDD